jgi:hypothetical protein
MATKYIHHPETVQEAHQKALQECQQKLGQVKEQLNQRKNAKGLNWASVGDLNHAADQLDALLEFLTGEA